MLYTCVREGEKKEKEKEKRALFDNNLGVLGGLGQHGVVVVAVVIYDVYTYTVYMLLTV